MIVQPHIADRIVNEDGLTEQTARAWMNEITSLVNFLEILDGTGSPESVVTAPKKKMYFDNSGSPGLYLYMKTTDTGNTGWVAIG